MGRVGSLTTAPARVRAGCSRSLNTRSVILDVVLVGAIILAAVLVRLPNLMLVPRLTDETEEVLIGLRIFRGQALPLVGVDTYIGGLFSYLVAGAFAVFGPRPDLGRLIALAFGALGVIPTYLLGRSVGGPAGRGRLVGLLAAMLLAGSATDILVTSRLAYSNSLTPFFTTTGLWLLHRAVRDRSGPALAGSGLALGLALQTHLAAVVIWPGLAVYLWRRRRALPLRWLPVAVLLGVVAVTNIIAFNVIHPGATFGEIAYRSGDYGGAPSAGLVGWPSRLGTLLRAYALALGGRASEYVEPEALLTPPVLAYAGLALVGLVALIRRRAWLLLLTLVAGLLTVSLLNARLEPVVARARHYAQLLPLGFIATATALVVLRDWLSRYSGPVVSGAALFASVVALLAASQLELHAYVTERLDRPDKNNRALLQTVDAITRTRRSGEVVYLDEQLASASVNSNRRGTRDFRYMLTVNGLGVDTIDVAQQPLPISQAGKTSCLIVLSQESLEMAAARYRLVPLPGEPGEGALVRAFRAYPLDQASR